MSFTVFSILCKRLDLVSSALTCKRWYACVSSMRFRPTQVNHRRLSCQTKEKLMNLIHSPLRHFIVDLSMVEDDRKHITSLLQEVNLAVTMPYLKKLTVQIHLYGMNTNKRKKLRKKDLVYNDDQVNNNTPIIEVKTALPFSVAPSITELTVEFGTSSNLVGWDDLYSSDEEDDEHKGDGEELNEQSAAPVGASLPTKPLVAGSSTVRVECPFHGEIGQVMQLFGTSTPSLRYLCCEFKSDRSSHYLPHQAISPFQSHAFLTWLHVRQPTQLCHDLICRMKQLKRIDGVTLGDTGCPRASRNPLVRPIPQLLYYRIDDLDQAKCVYFSRMTSLTSLHLEDCQVDPGEALFHHLPQLKKLYYYTRIEWDVIVVNPTTLVNAIGRYASQLEDLFLRHEELTSAHMTQLVPNMNRLRILRLSGSPIRTLSFLTQLASPSSLEYLYLECITLDTRAEFDSVPTMLPHLINFECWEVRDEKDSRIQQVQVRSSPGCPMEVRDKPSEKLDHFGLVQ